MNGSADSGLIPAFPVHFIAAIILIWAAGTGSPVAAQEASNRSGADLNSAIEPVSLAPPVSLIPASPAGGTPGAVRQSNIIPERMIAVRDLDEVSPDSLGLTDALSGGLPVDIWMGTSKELIDILLPRLPVKVSSTVSRQLIQQLLLSVARPPEPNPTADVFFDMTSIVPSAVGFMPTDDSGSDADLDFVASEDSPDLGILERRVAHLAAMGDWRNVRALVQLVPSMSLTEGIAKIQIDLALVEGGIDAACAESGERLSYSTEPYWQKVFAFCQLRDGNVAGAFLTIDLLREIGVDDAAFFWAAEIMAGNRPITPNGLRVLTPLQLAMLRSAGRPFPDQLVRNGDPTLLRVLAEAEPLFIAEVNGDEGIIEERLRRALDLRLESAERAVGLGALDPVVLRALYRAEIFEEDMVDDTVAGNEGFDIALSNTAIQTGSREDFGPEMNLNDLPVNTVLARARLFKLAEAQIIPTARAEVISRAIDYARADRGQNGPNVGAMGIIFAPLIAELAPAGDLVWFAGNAARALLAAGEPEAGRAWLELTRIYARTSIDAAEVAAAMWPIERQFQPMVINRFTPLRFKRWEETRSPGRLSADKTLVLSTLTALDETVTIADWMSLMDRQTQRSSDFPSPQIWNGLIDASVNQRVGESILFALIALGENGPSNVSPIVLSHVILAMIRIGMEDEARQIAVEAAIIQGL